MCRYLQNSRLGNRANEDYIFLWRIIFLTYSKRKIYINFKWFRKWNVLRALLKFRKSLFFISIVILYWRTRCSHFLKFDIDTYLLSVMHYLLTVRWTVFVMWGHIFDDVILCSSRFNNTCILAASFIHTTFPVDQINDQ